MPGTTTTGGDIDEPLRADIAGRVASGTLSIQEACTRYQLSRECIVEWLAAFRRSSLTAFDEHLRRTLADQGVDVNTLASAEFQGDLAELAIADLIQTLTLGRREGVITVSEEGRESRIWCAGGEIVDAESGKLTGAAAVHRMLAFEQGRVRASFTRVSRPNRVHVSTIELLLDGARRSDEARSIRMRLGSGPYRLAANAMSLGDSLTEQESSVLRQFDVPLRVADVLAGSELGDLEALTLLSRLVARECLVPDSEAVTSPRSLRPSQVSFRPPLVLTIAHTLAERGPRRWRTALVLGLGALGFAGALVPRYLVRSLHHEPAMVSLPIAAAAQPELDPVEPPRPEGTTTIGAAPAPEEAAEEIEPSDSPPLARGRLSARKRAGRSSARESVAPAASVRRRPPAPAGAAESTSAEPRMQIIDGQLPKMQILE